VEILWLDRALDDLEAARRYIADDNPAAAMTVFRLIIESTGRLATMPASGRAGRVNGTRELVISRTPYIVAYRVARNRVEILAIMHGARQWPGTFDN
jgi:toxin ParE1/3/4